MATPFPDSSASPWVNPDNGLTYIYLDERWRADLPPMVDPEYVKIAGDIMAGELTSPEFEAHLSVQIGTSTLTSDGDKLYFDGKRVLQKN